MKLKRRRVVEVPPKIKSFINNVKATTLENIEEPLKFFSWQYDKGDFHHWVELFNHFDSYFEKHVKQRKDLQFVVGFLEADSPFPREPVLEILRVTRIILENCTNKHFYSSFEQNLSSLLACTDVDVVEASLKTLAAFFKKTVGKCSIRDSNLTPKLLAFLQGWGSKDEGFGLIACSIQDGCDSVATRVGSTLHFEFYADSETSKQSCMTASSSNGLQVIHLPNIKSYNENDLKVLHKLVEEYKVPPRLCFSLFTRLRFARAFCSPSARQQYVCMRLYAFIILVQASNDSDNLSAFFNNEPEFVNELVSLLTYEDSIPEKIRSLGILSLAALCHDRSRQPSVLATVSSGGHRGILPGLMQKAIDSIINETGKWSIEFAEALLSLVTVLVSSSPGSSALQEAGFIPTLLPLLKDTKPQHIHLVSSAVVVLEAFMDYSNPAVALFRDLGGLDDTIARLRLEMSHAERNSNTCAEDLCDRKGKQALDSSSSTENTQLYHSEAMVSYNRKLLMKALLGAISLGTYAPGSTAQIYGSDGNLLPQCLCIIFRRAKDFGGGVFSLAATIMSDLIHKDPTCYSVLDAVGLPQAFLDSITTEVLISAEAITCIPQCLDALCLNNSGLQAVKDCNSLRCFVHIFTSHTYLRALSGDVPKSLSSGLDELIRHASSLKSSAVDIFLEILNTISKIGSGTEAASSEFQRSSGFMGMEMCEEAETSKIECSEQMVEGSSDISALNGENFLPEFISNATRLLGIVLQNGDTCRIFIEKKGIEYVLELFNLPLMPLFSSIGQNVAFAFKNFSPIHTITLARAICSFLKKHLKSLNELLASVDGANLLMYEAAMRMKILRSLASLEDILSLSNFLLKTTTSFVSEFGSSDVDVLKDLAKAYKEILWQISLCNDSKMEEKQGTEQEAGNADGQIAITAGRESYDDTNVVSVHGHASPFSVSSGSVSHWSVEQELLSAVYSAEGLHRHGRHGLSRARGGRTSRYLDINIESESYNNASEHSFVQDVRKKSQDILVLELLNKLGCTLHSFYASLVKGLTPRRRSDHVSLSPACKNVATALAKLFLEALSYSGQATTVLEMSLSVKCRYLGKVVDDMVSLIFDSRRRLCNATLVNSFYVNGTFKELLTTFEASSQLLLTLPQSLPVSGIEQGRIDSSSRMSQSSWLLNTLQSYCNLLNYFVNSSLLLPPSLPSHAQLLVQPVATGPSIQLDPEVFVQMLQTQVLDVILPIWKNPMFFSCNPAFISSVVSIVTHIYSGVGELKNGCNSTGNVEQRFSVRPLDESSIASIVEMGFTRTRAEEALRSIGTNSVEMAMDWLFSHPEECVQDDVQLAQALELSLGGTSGLSKEHKNDNKLKHTLAEERGADVPPVDDVLTVSMKLFQNGDAITFPLTDLLVALCNRNNGADQQKVVSFLIQKLKSFQLHPSTDIGALSQISHILALLLNGEATARELAADNGIVTAVLDILDNFTKNGVKDDTSLSKCLSTLFLILNNMMQTRIKLYSENNEENISGSQCEDIKAQQSAPEDKIALNDEKDLSNVLENILGKPTGYLTIEDGHRALEIACKVIKMHAPAVVMQAVLQLCARLTKTHVLAIQFLHNKCLTSLFNLPNICFFPGFDSLASVVIRHLLEDPQTLQTAMELEIRQTLFGSLNRNAGRLSPRMFLTSMAPVISRDPVIFMKAAARVCQLDSSEGRTNIVSSREKDKDKQKSISSECAIPSHESAQTSENRSSDQPSKCSRSHKKVPTSLFQVIDELLEIIMKCPSLRKYEDVDSITVTDADESATKGKGKSKIDCDIVSENSACFARITFALKLLTDILLMYAHAVGVVLRRDTDICQPQGLGVAEESTFGVVHHVLHQLLPLPDKEGEASDEWKNKLSEKSSWFLVVLCGRSGEGRKRVIGELVKAFSSFTKLESNSLVPNKRILAYTDLVYSILSKNSLSNSLPGSGCSPDIAKAMIDGGIVQSLTVILQVIDLDHPDAPKVVNLILKALEILTRAANASDQLYKSDSVNKKKSSASTGRSETFPMHEFANDQNVNSQNGNNDGTNIQEQQAQRSSQDPRNQEDNGNQSMDHDAIAERENDASSLPSVHGVEFLHEEIDRQDALHSRNGVSMSFQVEHHTDNEMVDEDDDMGEDADDDEDDEDDDIAEGAALMSLADTDADDHDENALGDYNDEMTDEDNDDFLGSGVIEVRWREGLTGLDRLHVLRGSADTSHLIDIAAEPFERANADDLFHFRRSLGIERRRHSDRNFLDRSSLGSSGFQHPLLIRPSHSGYPRQPTGNISRDVGSLSSGTFDLSHFYMIDNGIPPDYSGSSPVPPPLIDFSLGIDSLHVDGRRGPGDGRWSDDGRPQHGSQDVAIAQALEDQFVSYMHSMVPADGPEDQPQFGISTSQENPQHNVPVSDTRHPSIAVNDVSRQQGENSNEETAVVSEHQQGNLEISDPLQTGMPHATIDTESVIVEEEDIPRTSVPSSIGVQNNSPIEHNNMHIGLGVSLAGQMLDAAPVVNDAVQEDSGISANLQASEHPNSCINGNLRTGNPSSSQAVIDSSCTMVELSDDHAGVLNGGTNNDVNGADDNENLANCSMPVSDGEETLVREHTVVQEEANQIDLVNNNDNSTSHSIDPTFLEALPEDLRAEVLASQQTSQQVLPVQDAAYAPPFPEEIDPEFLAALPSDIQAEVLAQQRAQRFIHSQQAEGSVDMDNASILATFPSDLREEVLLTSPDTVLSSLPSNFLAEAQILRDRATSHYHARTRSNLFGGSHRLGGRRLAADRQGMIDRGVGVTIGRTTLSGTASNANVKEVEGIPLVDANALKALIRLLRLAQPLGKGLLQRLLLNLCAHTATRANLVCLLLDMIKLEADESASFSSRGSQRLFGCQGNPVYGLSQSFDGLPPLVSRRVLELLTYLATNHFSVANLLFYFNHPLAMELPIPMRLERRNKGKAKVSDTMAVSDILEPSWKEHTPILLFLKLVNKPLFLRSNMHLEQAMCLLQVVVNNVVSNLNHPAHSAAVPAAVNSESQPEKLSFMGNGGTCDSQKDKESSDVIVNASEGPSCDKKRMVNPFDILLKLPECDLQNLCSLLAHEGLSEKVYSLAADVIKKLAFAVVPHRKLFSAKLANLAHGLSVSAVNELITLRNTEMLGLSAGSMAGAAILRVLQTLITLVSTPSDENKSQNVDVEQQDQSILWNLNSMLEPLWQELSDCTSAMETKLGQNSTLSSSVPISVSGDLVGLSSSLCPPLPLGTQKLLPFIEAFFVLCEKLQFSQSVIQSDVTATAREVKESAGGSSSPSIRYGGIGNMTFARVVEKHRRLLNAFIRQNPSLLEKSLSMMLKMPRMIDFDNKRAYFRSKIRQQHDQHSSAPLRISVRRAYVLEDSYNQLRIRSRQDLKGRLTVQFQGEEGIDAGGLTREWYQLLSRVIFDKGALLFTTVGNNATFQPNPNSVYQTEHLSYFKFVGRVVAKALFDGQLLDVYFTRSFYKHILGVKVTYHDIEAVDPDYYKNLKWMLENDVSNIPDLTFSMDADEEKHILYEKNEVMDYELKPGGRNTRVTEETKHEYVDLVAEHILSTAIRPQINSFLEGFNELIPRDLISIFNDKELELLISGLPEIDFEDLKANTEYTGYTAASCVVQWFWNVVKSFNKEDMARFLQFVTGTSKVPLEGFKALQGISGPQKFQIHKAYGAPERLPSAHTCFNQLDLPEYSSKQQLEERLSLAIHEASEGFGFG